LPPVQKHASWCETECRCKRCAEEGDSARQKRDPLSTLAPTQMISFHFSAKEQVSLHKYSYLQSDATHNSYCRKSTALRTTTLTHQHLAAQPSPPPPPNNINAFERSLVFPACTYHDSSIKITLSVQSDASLRSSSDNLLDFAALTSDAIVCRTFRHFLTRKYFVLPSRT
jgi:hypothetical protein